MPEIDTDLFKVLTLFLLLLNLVALLGILSALNSLKGDRASERETPSQAAFAPTAIEPSFAQPAPASYQPSSYGAAPAEQRQTEQRQEVSTGFVPLSEAAPAVESPQPQTSGQVATPELRGDEPEEQPFERDGRWWFKRGGELLVYEEGTGQWVGASEASSGSAAPSTSTSTFTATSAPATGGPAGAGEGWKCSSCGAVNGSTATSCRMCFAPRY